MDGNKLISEFMGILTEVKGNFLYTSIHWGSKLTQYHTSFDWLMPVWFKFRDMEAPPEQWLKHEEWKEVIARAITFGDINLAHSRLVDGIAWYNQQSK